MVVAETVPAGWDVKILATDMDTNVLDTGSAGVYNESRLAGIEERRLKKWFVHGSGSNEGMVRAKPELRDMITFKRLNLMHEWPIKGPLDVIFCRNVIIYFDAQTKAALIDRYFDLLADHGTLFVGHSETLFGVTKRAKLVGKTIYEKQQ
jgi:chemotaxis protein methyltransferase CheR